MKSPLTQDQISKISNIVSEVVEEVLGSAPVRIASRMIEIGQQRGYNQGQFMARFESIQTQAIQEDMINMRALMTDEEAQGVGIHWGSQTTWGKEKVDEIISEVKRRSKKQGLI